MRLVIIEVLLLIGAFIIGLSATFLYPKLVKPSQTPVTREFTVEGTSTVPTGTVTAAILGSISVSGNIPAGSTMNVEARAAGTPQFSTVLQNLPATSNQTFSYTKATTGTRYDMKVTLLDPASKVLGISQIVSVWAPSLNVLFSVNSAVTSVTPTQITQTNPTPIPTLAGQSPLGGSTPTPTPATATVSGTISFHGVTPLNSRIVILQKLANASTYQVAVDNLLPTSGTSWHWDTPTRGTSYSILAVLKQKQADGTDSDFAYSSPVTITAPVSSVVLTIYSNYTLPKPSLVSTVSCTTYNSGPDQNTWNVTVTAPLVSGALSYWLQLGTTDGGTDIANTYGETRTVSAVFKNNTSYYAKYAYAAVAGVDTGSGQFSIFSDTTRLICSK